MGLTAVKKELKLQSKEQLINHIGELYKKFSNVKEYLDFYISLDEKELIKSYEYKIEIAFYSTKKVDLRKAKSILTNFKKLEVSDKALIAIHLHYIECAIDSASTYGYFSESLYNSTFSVFNFVYPLIEGRYEKTFKKKLAYIYNIGSEYGFDF